MQFRHQGGERRGDGMNQENEAVTGIDETLLADMRCPVSHAKLVQCGDWLYTTDSASRRKYPIRNGIPVLLIDAGVVVDDEEFGRAVAESSAVSKQSAVE